MEPSYFLKKRLFSPGPTPIPMQSQFAAVDNNPYHRSDTFNSIIINCLELLKIFYGTTKLPVMLCSSGTGAMEAALVNLTEPGAKVLVVSGGKFGERWEKIAKAYACDTRVIKVPWGKAIQASELESHLKKETKWDAVFLQAVETSTGVYFPIKELAKSIREHSDALIVVDALSSILSHEMNMDAWGLDCVIAASQKGFGAGTGLSFVACSQRAQQRLSSRPKFYFNLAQEFALQSSGRTAWTPATQTILTLQASLKALSATGREGLYRFHKDLCEAVRESVRAMGLQPWVREDYAHSVTSIEIPPSLDGEKLKSYIQKQYAMTIAGGQDELKGKILRLGHMGFVDPFDILSALGALELALRASGFSEAPGKGVSAFLQKFPVS